jgi:glycosyltransferase involved in cell wall biosynthesis
MPSLYEGFGTTVLEAFATGVPAIVSNVSSIPEIAGDAAVLVNPTDVDEIAGAMITVMENEKLRKELQEKGKNQAIKFDWKKCAEETLEVYRGVC